MDMEKPPVLLVTDIDWWISFQCRRFNTILLSMSTLIIKLLVGSLPSTVRGTRNLNMKTSSAWVQHGGRQGATRDQGRDIEDLLY